MFGGGNMGQMAGMMKKVQKMQAEMATSSAVKRFISLTPGMS